MKINIEIDPETDPTYIVDRILRSVCGQDKVGMDDAINKRIGEILNGEFEKEDQKK